MCSTLPSAPPATPTTSENTPRLHGEVEVQVALVCTFRVEIEIDDGEDYEIRARRKALAHPAIREWQTTTAAAAALLKDGLTGGARPLATRLTVIRQVAGEQPELLVYQIPREVGSDAG
jgi:hypothetical protein